MVDPDIPTAHWFTGDACWETGNGAAVGTGDLISVKHWQVQAKPRSANPKLRTFTLRWRGRPGPRRTSARFLKILARYCNPPVSYCKVT
ncbi:hypothetical protein ABIE18_004276 [Arthrobacter sp. 2762]